MGDYYESFVTDEARALEFTLDDLRAWKPAARWPSADGRRRHEQNDASGRTPDTGRQQTMTLIRELDRHPEQVHQGDFVLKLADGVAHADATLRDYVVTPQLNACFNDALTFIKQSVQGGTSKAAYLHGSFGSGKEPLHGGTQPAARQQRIGALDARAGQRCRPAQRLDAGPQIPARAVSHDRRAQHGVGDPGWLRRVRAQRHPDAPDPGLLSVGRLFEDAVRMRNRIGDEAFFRDLNAGSDAGDGDDSGWGELSGGWDAASFEAAMLEPPSGDDRAPGRRPDQPLLHGHCRRGRKAAARPSCRSTMASAS